MKILISAYACETGRGGEGEIGWRIVNSLAERHDVCVITRANLHRVHETSYAGNPKPAGLTFQYFDLPWIFRFYKKGRRFFLVYYYFWQIGVALKARRMLREQPADVLHHLIGGMDWMPAGLALCPGAFIWGPVGSENTHPIMFGRLPLRSRFKEGLRLALRWIMRNVDPFTRYTGARANLVLSHTPETLPQRYSGKVRCFTQTGITDVPELALPKVDVTRKPRLQLVYAGELKDWKGARIALDAALAFFESGAEADLTVIGDGPLRSEMEVIARAHPNGGQVGFLGRVSMERLVEELHQGDVFLYPSFHHGLATVVLQAMLTGLPVICIEGDATGRAIGQEAGITVSLAADRKPSIDLAQAIARLDEDEDLRQRLAWTSRKIALERYSYDALSRRIEQAYLDVLSVKRMSSDLPGRDR